MVERLGRYEILGELGRGAMGRVFRARDPIVDRMVAVKTLDVQEFPKGQQEEILRRFRREAQAAGQLTHPNIVTIYDVGENFFVMELVKGETLQAYLTKQGRVEPEEALRIVAPVANALDYAHTRGVVHRDVKPANIMLTERGVPKLMDFGLAKTEATVLTRAGQSLGSPAYMPPEQIQGFEPTSRADLYSLAVVTYELLTGSRPFSGKNVTTLLHQVVHAEPAPPRQFNAALPLRYDELFARALSKNPEERFADASSFVTELNLKELEAIVSLIGVPEPRRAAVQVSGAGEIHEKETLVAAEPRPTTSATERRPSPARTAARVPGIGIVAAAVGLVVVAIGLGRLLAPGLVALEIESSPPGATVWLSGAEMGTTPLVLERTAGEEHELTLTLPGYLSTEEKVAFDAGASEGPLVFALQPARASLFLTSTPSSAAVLVDGEDAGQTPLQGFELTEGPHRIEVRRRGYAPYRAELEARAGESLQIVARLEPVKRAPAKPADVEPEAAPVDVPELDSIAELGEAGLVPPKKIAGDFARYPDAARRRRQSGVVTVAMVISESGVPEEMQVVESAGDVLDQAVLAAVREWRFEPALRNGKPVRIHWRVRQHFRLSS
jgi:serine/threonine-protein kinase